MKITNKKKILDGIIIDVYSADVETEEGSFPVQVFKHPGAVCIAAQKEDGTFFLVDQFRFGLNQNLLEFPAGKIDSPEEDPLETAHRELREETGYAAKTMIPLGIMHPAGAYIDEVLYLYYAKDLSYVGQDLDEHETLELISLSLSELKNKIFNDDITDAKTIALVMKVDHYLNN